MDGSAGEYQEFGRFQVQTFWRHAGTRSPRKAPQRWPSSLSLPDFFESSDHDSGSEYSHIVLTSDGISSLVSHEEVNDLIRFAPTPAEGAKRVLSFAENIGSEDNATVIVVPLLGWGKPQGSDATKELREYKQNQAGKFVPVLPKGQSFDSSAL